MKNIFKNKNVSLFLYKLSIDIIFLLFVFFTFSFLFETILPGIISDHLSFMKLFFLILVMIFLATYLAMKNEISFEMLKTKKNKLLLAVLSFFFVLITTISVKNFLGYEIAIIMITSCAILFYFHKILMK